MANEHTRTHRGTRPLSLVLVFGWMASVLGARPASAALPPLTPGASAVAQGATGYRALEAFHLVSADEGWLLMDQRLYWTKTGGQSWEDITPSNPGRAVIRAVSFLDARHGWLVLTESDEAGSVAYALARTSDGGNTWQLTPLSLFEPGNAAALASAVHVYFIDSQTGWLVVKRATSSSFSVGALFRTLDGGESWTPLTIPIGEPAYFVTSEIGWTAGGATGEALYRTLDGGLTWSPQLIRSDSASTGQRRLYQLPKFENEREGVLPVVLADGPKSQVEFYVTQDGGQSWNLSSRVPLEQEIGPGVEIPLAIFGVEQWLLIVPGRAEVVSRSNGTVTAATGQARTLGGIRELDMATPRVGWARHMAGDCSQAPQTSEPPLRCELDIRLLRTDDGGQTWRALVLPEASASQGAPEKLDGARVDGAAVIQSLGSRTQPFTGHGFDSCTRPSVSQMQTWITYSPYRVWNLYLGGSSLANCGTLTASFIAQLAQQGWKFIPTWVGPQASCSTIPGVSRMSSDPAVAHNQGVSEANAAVDRAASLGLTLADSTGTILYYDLESYNTGDAVCRNAASAFISGWSGQLRSRGNQAGVYGSPCGSALSDFANIAHVPDAIWAAYWVPNGSYDPNASVWNLPCLSNTLWTDSQRLRQYTGGHNETWGGVTLNIDSDVLDGIVASICPATHWKGEYWSNATLSGLAQLCRDDPLLDFDWGWGSPSGNIPADNFSARWTRTLSFPAGQYRFHIRHDDGARLFIDDVLRLDAWSTCCRWRAVDVALSSGNHTIRMEMFENTEVAYAALRWERLDITGWRGEYYNNPSLSGHPVVVRDDGADIDFDWLGQPPDPMVQADQFSVRWTRTITFTEGVYRFDVFHDDGARLYVDDALVLDNWCSNCRVTDSVVLPLSGGPHALRLEMWDNEGFAAAQLSWQMLDLDHVYYFPLIFKNP